MHLKVSVGMSRSGQYFRRQQDVGAVGAPCYSRKRELRYVVLKWFGINSGSDEMHVRVVWDVAVGAFGNLSEDDEIVAQAVLSFARRECGNLSENDDIQNIFGDVGMVHLSYAVRTVLQIRLLNTSFSHIARKQGSIRFRALSFASCRSVLCRLRTLATTMSYPISTLRSILLSSK